MLKFAIAVAVGLLAASPAAACDCMSFDTSWPRFKTDLEMIVTSHPVAADGVLEADGPYAWRFRAAREFRGTRQAAYRITLQSDCSLGPDEMKALIGKPIFLVLSGGPENFEAQRCVNQVNPDVKAAIRRRYSEGCNRH